MATTLQASCLTSFYDFMKIIKHEIQIISNSTSNQLTYCQQLRRNTEESLHCPAPQTTTLLCIDWCGGMAQFPLVVTILANLRITIQRWECLLAPSYLCKNKSVTSHQPRAWLVSPALHPGMLEETAKQYLPIIFLSLKMGLDSGRMFSCN